MSGQSPIERQQRAFAQEMQRTKRDKTSGGEWVWGLLVVAFVAALVIGIFVL